MRGMLQQRFFRFTSNFIAFALVAGVVLLSYSVFADSYATDRTLPPAPIEITPPITEPRLDIVSGLVNDQSLIFGPWLIINSLANLQVTNASKETFIMSFDLKIDMAFCVTPREVSITVDNLTKTYTLDIDSKLAQQSVQFAISPAKFFNITVQVSGPVCQVDSDSRLFFGSVAISNYEYRPANEFNFKS
jgi:hypothetical protein